VAGSGTTRLGGKGETVTEKLIQEAEAESLEAVIELLSAGADVNSVDEWGLTALMAASIRGHADAVNVLVEHGAEIEAREKSFGCTALMFASLAGTSGAVEMLLGYGADPNARDRFGRTALMAAAAVGNIRTVRLLMAEGADVHLESAFGTTAADLSAIEGHTEITALLMPPPRAGETAGRRAA
jgi:uncharacterized protein